MLRARLVLPIARPAIANGAVLISGRHIVSVGRWRDCSSEDRARALDLGEVVLLPGLVNAHCHLDYTGMAGQFPPPKLFTDWLKLITTAKSFWTLADYADSWRKGADMLLRTGTTTVGDIEAVPQLLPAAWKATPLRVFSFLEMIGLTSRRAPGDILREVTNKIDSLAPSLGWMGLSPHAPYTTGPELLRLNAAAARQRQCRVSTHLSESAAEFDMFAHGQGEMFAWLRRSGRDMSDCGRGSPVRHLERCGLLSANLLAAHVNYLAAGDAALLARRKASIVHCPRSHSYFHHARFAFRRLRRAGINICLGTDSLASVYKPRRQNLDLNMFEEMRALAGREPSLSAKTILRMATINGALALGLRGQIGELSKGALADIIAVPFSGRISETYDALVQHSGQVAASLIGGKWALPPNRRP